MFQMGFTPGLLRQAANAPYEPIGEVISSDLPGAFPMELRHPAGGRSTGCRSGNGGALRAGGHRGALRRCGEGGGGGERHRVGLAVGPITSDPDRGLELARRIGSGIVQSTTRPSNPSPKMPSERSRRGERMGPVRGPGGRGRVHRAPLGHRPERDPTLPLLGRTAAAQPGLGSQIPGPRSLDPCPVRRLAADDAVTPPRASKRPGHPRRALSEEPDHVLCSRTLLIRCLGSRGSAAGGQPRP